MPAYQIIVVDFEYAAPNAAAFDVANHFHEWTSDYHGPTPSLLRPELYPTAEQRRNFYAAYLSVVNPEAKVTPPQLDVLDAQVRAWSPASHGMWAMWGVVQAREQLESGAGEVEFDYISYARCRFRLFEEEVARLGA
jgi:choline kinase